MPIKVLTAELSVYRVKYRMVSCKVKTKLQHALVAEWRCMSKCIVCRVESKCRVQSLKRADLSAEFNFFRVQSKVQHTEFYNVVSRLQNAELI